MTNPSPTPADASRYEIRVAGRLDERWSARFDRVAIRALPDGTTAIATEALDQAALHGLLRQVRDAGLHLVSVTPLDP